MPIRRDYSPLNMIDPILEMLYFHLHYNHIKCQLFIAIFECEEAKEILDHFLRQEHKPRATQCHTEAKVASGTKLQNVLHYNLPGSNS